MTYAMRFLRAELNRERAWENGYFKSLAEERKIHPSRSLEMTKRQKEQRILSFELAIKALKMAKKSQEYQRPEYYWLNPKTKL